MYTVEVKQHGGSLGFAKEMNENAFIGNEFLFPYVLP